MKQHNILGNWWGLLKLLGQHTMTYVQFINLAMISGTFYLIVTEKVLAMPFWLFGVVILVIIVLLMLFEYTIGWPSFFGVWNRQVWEHNNPMKTELEKIEKELAKIKKILKEKK